MTFKSEKCPQKANDVKPPQDHMIKTSIPNLLEMINESMTFRHGIPKKPQ